MPFLCCNILVRGCNGVCVALILALDCKVSSLYQPSVIVMNSKTGYAKECLK